MINSFPQIQALKQRYPGKIFHTQAWAYAGLIAYFSQQQRFEQLEFSDTITDFVIHDWQHTDFVDPEIKYHGLVYEGHVDYWCPVDQMKNCVIITGHQHLEKHPNNVISLGFDFCDINSYRMMSDSCWFYEINRASVSEALHDVSIPVGVPKQHRLTFLQKLQQQKRDLSIVIGRSNQILETELTFENQGVEVYFNKFGITNFASHKNLPHPYNHNGTTTLAHLPHKKMHSIARVNVALETTCYSTSQAHLSEKTFKILANARPFVILGDTNILSKLQQQGFKTFGEFCDESYDTEADLDQRIQKVIQAMHDLAQACKQSPSEIDLICQHNQQRFFDRQRHTDNMAEFGKLILEHIF